MAEPIKPHGLYKFDGETPDSEKTVQVAWVVPADHGDVAEVLAQPVADDGRSEWCWVRMVDGTLLLATFPMGDTYMSVSDKGACDWEDVAYG